MRKLLIAAILCLLWAAPARATWTEVQHTNNSSCGSPSCTITFSATTAGNVGVIIDFGNSDVHAVGGGTWTVPPGCALSGTRIASCAYILSLPGGLTSTVVLGTAGANARVDFLEFSSSNPHLFDAVTSGLSNTSPPVAPSINITGANDLIVYGTVGSVASPSACASPYNVNGIFDTKGAVCYAINTGSKFAPVYTAGSGISTSCGIAFMEVTSAGMPPGIY